MTDLEIKHKELSDLVPYVNNPKNHPQEQVDKIASSIKEFGFKVPMLITEEDEIIAGHGRYKASKKLGLDSVPCIVASDLSEAEVKAFRLADNRVAESGWDEELLGTELEALDSDFDFDLDLTGFDEIEIEDIWTETQDLDEVNELQEEPIENKDLKDIKALNLYAGIGGNRKLWGNEIDVTAVEYNKEIAKAYQDFFPNDEVIIEDAHKYLENHFSEFDFIWSSPPCPTHSKIRKNTAVEAGHTEPVYPDLKLYEEILFLKGYFDGKWVVENVNSWYDPLIEPQERDRHYFWSNFDIKDKEIDKGEKTHNNSPEKLQKYLGFDLSDYTFPNDYPKQKILNNCVHPELGKYILECAFKEEI